MSIFLSRYSFCRQKRDLCHLFDRYRQEPLRIAKINAFSDPFEGMFWSPSDYFAELWLCIHDLFHEDLNYKNLTLL